MKSYSLLFISFCLVFIFSANINSNLNILEAIQNKKITTNILGNDKSTHYHEPILMTIKNNTFTDLNIAIPSGTLFLPDNKQEQTLIAVQDIYAKLMPNQSKEIAVKAMCIEPSDRAGSGASKYTLNENKNDTLIKLAHYIYKNKYFTACAQTALWTLVNKNSLSNVYGSDSIEQKNLRKFLADNAGLKILNYNELNDYRYNYFVPPAPKETLSGYFQFGMLSPHHIQIAMFDTTGILVRELFNQHNFLPKKNEKLAYQFDFSVYTQDKYFVKLIVDDEVIMTRTVNAKATRDKYKKALEERN